MNAAQLNSPVTRSRQARNVICEALEDRQLMSLTIEVRNLDGTSTGVASKVGQVIDLEVLAVVTDSAHTPSLDGLQDVNGDFISTAATGGAVAGNLAAVNVAPFNATASAPGKLQDLNHDGNIDVGIAFSAKSTQGLFFARSSPAQTAGSEFGTISGDTLTFKIATLKYTVTKLNLGGTTDINFSPYIPPLQNGVVVADAASWIEDGQQEDNSHGTFQAGSPYTLSAPSAQPRIINEPVSEFAGISKIVRVGYLPGVSVQQIAQLHGTVNWGDGSSTPAEFDRNKNGGIDILAPHKYAKTGTFTITTSEITETAPVINGVSAQYILNLGQVSTTATVAATPAQLTQTAGKSFTAALGKFNQFTLDIYFTATINWGDGVTTTGTVSGGDLAQGNWTVTGTHTYANSGDYVVQAYVYSHIAPSQKAGSLVDDFVTLIRVVK